MPKYCNGCKSTYDVDRNFKPGFKIDLHIKDLNNVLETSHSVGVPLPITSHVMEIKHAIKLDRCRQEHPSIIVKFYEKNANSEVSR